MRMYGYMRGENINKWKVKNLIAITVVTTTVGIGINIANTSLTLADSQGTSVNTTTPAAVTFTSGSEKTYATEVEANADGFTVTLINSGTEYKITNFDQARSGAITIPTEIAGISVTSIGNNAFESCTSLTSIDIPSVRSIGNAAFFNCNGLTSIDIPSSVSSIGINAFQFCTSLTSIDIPSSITSIDNYVFYGCSGLTSINIPNSVKTIGYNTFTRCSNLTSIDIPSSVTSIADSAFESCTGLTSIDIPTVTSIGNATFYNCSGLTSITIPSSVTSIGNNAFQLCSNLTSIRIPGGVTSIGSDAFTSINNSATFYVATSAVKDLVSGYNKTTIIYTLTLTFDSKGGTTTTSINAGYKTAITLPTAPIKEGYTFDGWYTDEEYTKTFVESTGITDNTTVYAKWKVNNYTLIFDSKGGTTITSINAAYKTAITLPTAPVRDEYSFSGWYTDIALTTPFDASIGIAQNTTVYAKWTVKESNSNNGNHSSSKESSTVSDTIYSKADEESIRNAIHSEYIKIIVDLINNSSNLNNGNIITTGNDTINNTLLISKSILDDLKIYAGKTLVIKTDNSSTEIKSDKEEKIQFTQNGVEISGFKLICNSKYYLNSNGIMQTGWVEMSGSNWYHLNNETGICDTKWLQETTGEWYYLDRITGLMQRGWIKDTNNYWYYLDKVSGKMKTGWFKDIDNSWYYLDKFSGKMRTGWIQDGEEWYYLYSNGSLAVSTTIYGYRVNENGKWVQL
jgi:uncharacterized repeat protein (TIGR02543 family)